jgi:hypothetical protein
MSQVNFANATIDHLRGYGVRLRREEWHCFRTWLQKSAEELEAWSREQERSAGDTPSHTGCEATIASLRAEVERLQKCLAYDREVFEAATRIITAFHDVIRRQQLEALDVMKERDTLRARVAVLEGAVRAAAWMGETPHDVRCGACSSLVVLCNRHDERDPGRCVGPRLRAALKGEGG